MFGHTHHEYQAIFEVALAKSGTDPLADYLEDRRTHPSTKMYGFEPIIDETDEDPLTDPFILTDLVTPANPHDPQSPPVRSLFKGNIWRGHFEASPPMEHFVPKGERVSRLERVVAQLTHVILFRKFDLHAQALPQLEYFLFGNIQELFLAHVITKPPDFDQVLHAQVEGHQFTDDELRRGVLVTFPGRPNSEDRKLEEQEQVSAQVQVPAERPDGPRSLTLRLTAGTEFYFETGDLKRSHRM